MKFVDYVKIYVKAGDGGRGCVSFRREKYVPMGGPNGGDGGTGGHIIVKATKELNTLLDFRYQRQYKAKRGEHGKGSNKHGKDGGDRIIPVPIGTLVKDAEIPADNGDIIADLNYEGAEIKIAKAGRGGLGNAHFATSTRQAPKFAQPGEKGEEMWLVLELKLLADVGLIGLPNAGKSTLISVISSAKPKIADYPFTTLIPNLGVVKLEGIRSFVAADIPGLIEGAHRGTGLGFQFLRHIERTSILLHLVDISDVSYEQASDPVDNFEKINKELALYSPKLLKKPMVVAGTKLDTAYNKVRLKRLRVYCRDKGLDFFEVCALTGEGINELVIYLSKMTAS